jgi:predicted metal-dependent phosphoesterase TrpH
MVTPAELVAAAVTARLDLIAVTDHDTMASVQETQDLAESAALIVVPGQEITTAWPAQTHIVGWFLQKPVKRGMSVEDTVDAIHDQGALAIVPHPFMPVYFGSIQPGMLRRLIETHKVDGIEMVFTTPIGRRRKQELADFYKANRDRLGAAIGGSDCHFGAHDLGRAVTQYDGDFRTAVEKSTTVPQRRREHSDVPIEMSLRQQWRALVHLPLRRLRREL